MDNRIVKVAIGAAITVVLLATVLVPVINDTAATTRTFSNTDDILAYMTEIDEQTEYSFSWDPDDPTVVTVNGDKVNLPNTNMSVVISTDHYLIRYGSNSSGYYMQSAGGTVIFVRSNSSSDDYGSLDINISGGTLTSTVTKSGSDPVVATESITNGYAIAAKGNYVMKSPTQSAYLLSDSTITAAGVTTLDGAWQNLFQITGTCSDYVVEQIIPSPATYTISDVTDDKAAVDGYNDLYTLKEIKFKVTQILDSSKIFDCTYNYFIVPAEVTAEITDPLDDNAGLILKTIPVMIIAALLVAIIAVILRNRE